MDNDNNEYSVPTAGYDTNSILLKTIIASIVDSDELVTKFGNRVSSHFTKLIDFNFTCNIDVKTPLIHMAFAVSCLQYLDVDDPNNHLLIRIQQMYQHLINSSTRILSFYSWKRNIDIMLSAALDPFTRYIINIAIDNQVRALQAIEPPKTTPNSSIVTYNSDHDCDCIVPNLSS
jgi:hypothetical protein